MKRISPAKIRLNSTETGKISLWILIPVGIVALLVVVYLLFANMLLKSAAEQVIGQANGAEANIEDFDHSLFPFGVTLSGIQITDNAAPSRNKVVIDTLSGNVELMPLLSNKVIVDNLIASNIEFGTRRQQPGEVYAPVDSTSSFAFPTLEDLPSVDDVLDNTPLKTTEAVAQAQSVYEKYNTPLSNQYDALPSKDKISAYKQRIKTLSETDYKNPVAITQALEEFKNLKAEIKREKEKVSEFVDLAKQAKQDISGSVEALKTAPQQDYDLLKGLVAGDQAAISQVTQHLFGEHAKLYTQALVAVADMLKNSGQQADDEQAETANDSYPEYPNLWIKNADISIKWLNESLSSSWSNITESHQKVGSPTTFLIDSKQAKNWQAFMLDGSIEIINGEVNSIQSWDIQQANLENLPLVPESAQQKLTAMLNSGMLNSTGKLNIISNQLSGQSVFDLNELKLDANGSNDLTNAIAGILEQQQTLSLAGLFSGSLSQPSIEISSDLDANLLSSLGAGMSNNPKLAELKQKLNAKAADQLGTSAEQLDVIGNLLDAAQGDTSALESLLNAKMADKKDDLLNKLKGKFFN